MATKNFFQLSLLILILLISITVIKIYFVEKKLPSQPLVNENIENPINKGGSDEGDIIYDIEYIAKDRVGNQYIIKSKYGYFLKNQLNRILMKEVSARINIKNSEPIEIFAVNALYDNQNYDTNFYEDVLITFDQNKITANKLNLFFNKNLASISENVIYTNLNSKLLADGLEINLITKDTKIFMNDTSKQIKIIKQN